MQAVIRLLGILICATSVAMLPSVWLSVSEGLLWPWLGALAVTVVVGASLWLSARGALPMEHGGSLLIVGLGWCSIVTVGATPFLLTGVAPGPVEALFESVSGFTTTGATIFANIEGVPRSILLWRSVSHWIGGMGIIVLSVAILPFLGVGGAQLFKAEAPGIPTDRLTPRIASTARLLWTVYSFLTVVLVGIYLALGMTAFDAVNHAMSTLATGGFSTRTASMAAFSPAIQWVTILFMFAAGMNFALHFRFLSGRLTVFPRDAEWRTYLAILLGAVAICFAFGGVGRDDSVSVREAMFNVTAVMTTTGYATDDFAAWPAVSQIVLLGLMFVGAMGGSTGGGFKVVRALVLAKHALNGFRLILHPKAVVLTRFGGHAVSPGTLLNVVELFALYIVTHGVGAILLAALGSDFTTAVSATLAAMSSIGPGLGAVGPVSNYGDLGSPSLLVLSALMLLGRLEFYTLLIVFLPETWRLADRKTVRPG